MVQGSKEEFVVENLSGDPVELQVYDLLDPGKLTSVSREERRKLCEEARVDVEVPPRRSMDLCEATGLTVGVLRINFRSLPGLKKQLEGGVISIPGGP